MCSQAIIRGRKMKIIYKHADLLAADEPCIVHGVNAQHKYRSGVAGQIREKFPHAYDCYMNAELILGVNIWAECDPYWIVNSVTQDRYGNDGKMYADYNAIRNCMILLNEEAPMKGITAVAMPKIGCGLGGADWEIVSEIIEETLTNVQPVVYVFP